MLMLPPDEIAYEEAHINDNRGPILVGVTTILLVLGILAALGRFASRRMTKAALATDDWLVLFSLVCLIGLSTEIYVVTCYGVGKHVITLTIAAGTIIGQTTFALEITYPFLVCAVKLSVLFLYRRIFTMRIKYFAIFWWALIFYLVAFFVSINVVILTACHPISSFWDLSGPIVCRVSYIPGKTFAILNAISDFAVLCLPVHIVWNLQMPVRQRVATAGIFLLGSFVIIVSCLRIPSLQSTATGVDPTYEEVNGLIWTVAECAVGLICACLPVMRPLFLSSLGKTQLSRSKASKQRSGASGSRHWREINVDDETPIRKDNTSLPTDEDVIERYSARGWAEGQRGGSAEEGPAPSWGVQRTQSIKMEYMQSVATVV